MVNSKSIDIYNVNCWTHRAKYSDATNYQYVLEEAEVVFFGYVYGGWELLLEIL